MQLVNSILIQTNGSNGSNPVVNNDSGAVVGWMLGFGLALVAIVLVAKPLVQIEAGTKRRRETGPNPGQLQLEGLQESANAEKQALQDLDFDRELGIIEEADYTTLKERSNQKLATLNEQIAMLQQRLNGRTAEKVPVAVVAEKLAASAVSRSGKSKTGDTDKFHLKAAVKEKLKCGECGTAFRPGDRFCRQCSAPLPVLCLNCGHEISEDDRFCAKCGAAVNT